MELTQDFKSALWVLEKLENNGFEAYFVGGSVRDLLLGKPSNDIDITTSATPLEVKDIFKKTIDIGIEHGTVLVLGREENYEVTTFRTDGTYSDHRRPEKVEFVRSLKEDLRRRDFTINAFALSANGEIVDMFDGLSDLKNKILRTVENPFERFDEDALRIMRLSRFVSQLGFEVEPKTFEAARELSGHLEHISIERKLVEIEKLFLGDYKAQGIDVLIETRSDEYCPGFKELKLKEFSEIEEKNIVLAWSKLLWISDVEDAKAILKPWKASNQMIKDVQSVLKWFEIADERALNDYELYKFGLKYVELIDENYLEKYENLIIKSRDDINIDGKILMEELKRKPGVWLKIALNLIEKNIVEKKLANKKEEIIEWISSQSLI
ncbi:MAG: CCA tRNA nucleotidyltransferase [Lactobacillales bacterium]|jgi:tRNA nucleotidyltransferase (CCA-adding enzyme)|nr:CCA tRNA nucleotidyltransferase [Lactobacillales bacterium]